MKEKRSIYLPKEFIRQTNKKLTPDQLKYANILERLEKGGLLNNLVKPLTISRLQEWFESIYTLRYCTDPRVQEYRANAAAKLLGYENLEEYLNKKEKHETKEN